MFERLRRARGVVAAASAFAVAFVAVIVALPVAADLTIQRVAPEEVFGWGERPSLEPDAVFGWKLRPNATTRLRWVSDDYTVSSTAPRLPRPPPTGRRSRKARIASSSPATRSRAPRASIRIRAGRGCSERDLARDLRRPVQVLDFSVTGYGPEQEAAVAHVVVPRFSSRPRARRDVRQRRRRRHRVERGVPASDRLRGGPRRRDLLRSSRSRNCEPRSPRASSIRPSRSSRIGPRPKVRPSRTSRSRVRDRRRSTARAYPRRSRGIARSRATAVPPAPESRSSSFRPRFASARRRRSRTCRRPSIRKRPDTISIYRRVARREWHERRVCRFST